MTKLPNGVELKAGAATVRVTAVADSVARVRVAPNGPFVKDASWAVAPSAELKTPAVQSSENADSVEITLPAGHIRILKNPLRVIFLGPHGEVLSEDDERSPMAFDGGAFRVTKKMPEDELYFGLGDKTTLNLRDRAFSMWNTDAYNWQEATDPLYKSIPFFTALRHGKAYGIFLDNPWRTHFDFGKASRDSYSFGSDGGELNYYFFFGPDPKKVLTAYADLTGKTPLPPLWALGYQQCRYSYYPESRVLEVARTFREKKIPADVIYLDIDYQDHYRPFTINRQYFPHFETMIKQLRAEGFSPILITDLHIAEVPGYKPYDEGVAKDMFVKNPDGTLYVGEVWPGKSVFPEFTLSRAREWWGTLYKDFVGMGVRGFWNDMNEPAIFGRPDKTMPLATLHRLDDGTTVDHRAVHNIFGMENSRATYEGVLKLQGNERPLVLTRASYAGGQRYAASWTGDNSSTWNHMRMTLPTLLNLGISGYPLVGADIGGYRGSPPPDLLTRWLELGAFIPVYRDHTEKGSADQEPWVHGPQHEAWRKKFIEQRYRMLPYIYTVAEEMSRTGLPMMRPLFLEFPAEERLAANQDEFMFGHDMLVVPKVWELLDSYEVQLPQGDWYDYWTGLKVDRAKLGRVNPKMDELLVYIRAGAIIPQQPLVQNTQEVPQGPLELRVYPGPECAGSLYMDDGHTFNYQHGEFLRQELSCSLKDHSLSVETHPAQGTYKPWFRQTQFTIYGVPNSLKSVALDGRSTQKYKYDAASSTVTVLAPYVANGTKIEVQY
ncbi:MAG TPA: glycoside hydrolase family 31 protein [Terriglobales bacterium]